MTRLKIAFVVSGTGFDGPERQVLHLVRRLDQRRYEPLVVSLAEPGPLAIKLQHAAAPVHTVALPTGPAGQRAFSRFLALNRMSALLRQMAPDIVHAFGMRADVWARAASRLARVPIVIGSYREHRAADDPLVRWARRMRGSADHVVATTAALAAEARQRIGIGDQMVSVVPPAIDLEHVRGQPRAEDLQDPALRIGALLTLGDAAGVDVLLDAAAAMKPRHPDVQWLVIGTSDDPIPWLRRSQRMGLDGTVNFVGMRSDVGHILAALDVFVAPGRVIGLPAALLEALAAGRACVAARNPSIDALLTHNEHALLVPAGDAAALATAVGGLINDVATQQRLGRAGAVVAAAFGIEPAVVALHDLYERLVTAAPRES